MDTPQYDIVRAVPPSQVEMRAEGDGDGSTLTGHFSVFDTWYEVNSIFEGHFLERIAPGAFRDTMAEDGDRVKVTFNHGMDPTMGDQVLGDITDMREDGTGAFYEVDLFSGVPALIVDGLRAGVYGASFRFRVTADEWDDEPETSSDNPRGIPERTITKVRLFEFGPVTFPANPEATAGLRSLTDEYVDQLRERAPTKFEAAMRAAGRDISTGQPDAQRAGGGGPDAKAGTPAASSTPPQPPKPRKETKTMDEQEFMSVDERTARLDEINVRLTEIDAEHNGGALPDDLQAEWDELDAEYDRHEAAIAAATARRERLERNLNRQPVENTRVPPTPHSLPRAARGADENIYDMAAIRRSVSSVDELPARYRDNAKRAIESASFPGANVNREDAQTQAERLIDTLDTEDAELARRILATGSPAYNRAFGKAVMALSTVGLTAEEQRALSLGTNSAGGFAVPFQLDPTVILTSDGRINPLRSVSRVEQIVGKEWQGITSTGITVSRAAEAGVATDDSPTLAQPTVAPTRVHGFVPFSVEIDQDWNALRSEMTMMLADAKEEEEATSFTTGDGTGNNPSGVVATLDGGSVVGQSGAAGAFTVPDDLFAVEEALPPRFRAMARFMANRSIYNQVRGASTGSDGGDLWVRLGAGLPSELIGYPAHELSSMDGTIEPSGGGDNLILLFGDFRHFLIVDRIGMSVELVPHLFDQATARPTGQRGIYAIWRNSSVILADNAFRLLNVVSGV